MSCDRWVIFWAVVCDSRGIVCIIGAEVGSFVVGGCIEAESVYYLRVTAELAIAGLSPFARIWRLCNISPMLFLVVDAAFLSCLQFFPLFFLRQSRRSQDLCSPRLLSVGFVAPSEAMYLNVVLRLGLVSAVC